MAATRYSYQFEEAAMLCGKCGSTLAVDLGETGRALAVDFLEHMRICSGPPIVDWSAFEVPDDTAELEDS